MGKMQSRTIKAVEGGDQPTNRASRITQLIPQSWPYQDAGMQVCCVGYVCVWAPGKDSNSSLASRVPCSAVYGQTGEQTSPASRTDRSQTATDGKESVGLAFGLTDASSLTLARWTEVLCMIRERLVVDWKVGHLASRNPER